MKPQICILLHLTLTICYSTSTAVVQLNQDNARSILESAQLSFVNFYADWCRFSQSLSPIIDEVAEKLKVEFPSDQQLLIGRVDCQVEESVAKYHGVMKYPTMKLFRFGQMQRREYRGQRSVEAIADYIREQLLQDPVVTLAAPVEPSALPLEPLEGAVIGQFESNSTEGMSVFRLVADRLREDCKFVAVVGSQSEPEKVFYQKGTDPQTRIALTGSIREGSMTRLVQENCQSVVREMTFENAEEMAEEGKPLFILFYRAGEPELVDKFRTAVEKHLRDYSSKLSFLSAMGPLFTRALRHMRKTVNDLPLIAIDSYQHMYIFPHDALDSVTNYPSRLVAFAENLVSGRLHDDYHKDHPAGTVATEPPPSVFRRLGPSASRYSFSKEEL